MFEDGIMHVSDVLNVNGKLISYHVLFLNFTYMYLNLMYVHIVWWHISAIHSVGKPQATCLQMLLMTIASLLIPLLTINQLLLIFITSCLSTFRFNLKSRYNEINN